MHTHTHVHPHAFFQSPRYSNVSSRSQPTRDLIFAGPHPRRRLPQHSVCPRTMSQQTMGRINSAILPPNTPHVLLAPKHARTHINNPRQKPDFGIPCASILIHPDNYSALYIQLDKQWPSFGTSTTQYNIYDNITTTTKPQPSLSLEPQRTVAYIIGCETKFFLKFNKLFIYVFKNQFTAPSQPQQQLLSIHRPYHRCTKTSFIQSWNHPMTLLRVVQYATTTTHAGERKMKHFTLPASWWLQYHHPFCHQSWYLQ